MMRWLMLSTSLLDAVILAIIFTAADMPVNEVETYLTYCSIHNILIIPGSPFRPSRILFLHLQ